MEKEGRNRGWGRGASRGEQVTEEDQTGSERLKCEPPSLLSVCPSIADLSRVPG